MRKISNSILAAFNQALLGEVYNSMRAIAVRIDSEDSITIRLYLDRPEKSADSESADMIANNFETELGETWLKKIEVEILNDESPIGKLNSLDGLVFARREWSSDEVS